MSAHKLTVYFNVPDPDEGLRDLITDEVAEVVFKHDQTAVLSVEEDKS